jgi:hypothetical protein
MANIKSAVLERAEQVAADIKKVFMFDKHAGTWAWSDRDEESNAAAHHTGFATRYAALMDAVGPYIEEGEG